MEPLDPVLRILAFMLALCAGVYDLRYRRIPNWLVLPGAVAAFAAHTVTYGLHGAQDATLGFLLAAGVYLVLYVFRAVGGGDLKLMAALGAILGPKAWLLLFVTASLLGGLVALVMIFTRGALGRTVANIGTIFWELAHFRLPHRARPDLDVHHPSSNTLPHGAVIAVSVILYLWAVR